MPSRLARLLLIASMFTPAAAAQNTPITPPKATPTTPAVPNPSNNAAQHLRRHGLAQPPAKAPGVIRLATYNIDLFDDKDDPALTGRRDDLRRAMPMPRRLATADAIHRLDADILALQEVESLDALTWYRDAYLPDMGYTHAASIDVGHAIGLEQSVLSRFPIIDTQTWTDMPIGVHPPTYRGRPNKYAGRPMHFRRSPLMVEIDLANHDGETQAPDASIDEAHRLTLLVVHAKTGRGSDAWRKAESAALARIVADLKKDRPARRVIVLGDFAADAGSKTLDPLLESGFHDIFANDPRPADAVATSITGNRDCFILVGPNAAPMADGTPRFVLGTPAPPKGLKREIARNLPGFASDHYPVAVDLRPDKP